MRRSIKSLLAVGALLVYGTSNLYAYPFGESGSSETTTEITNQSNLQEIIVDNVKTLSIEESIAANKNVGYIAAQYIYNDKVKAFNIPLGYMFDNGFGIEVNIPYMFVDKHITRTGNNENGLGDISLGVNYHLGTVDSSTGLNLFTLRYKTTTGDEDSTLGSGASAYTISYKFLKSLDVYKLHFQGDYTFNNDATIGGVNYNYGDSYFVSVGGSMPCILSDKVRTSAKLTYFHANATKFWGMKSGKTDTSDLWIQWNSSTLFMNVPLGIGVKIPLKNEVDGNDIGKRFTFYISASGLF